MRDRPSRAAPSPAEGDLLSTSVLLRLLLASLSRPWTGAVAMEAIPSHGTIRGQAQRLHLSYILLLGRQRILGSDMRQEWGNLQATLAMGGAWVFIA